MFCSNSVNNAQPVYLKPKNTGLRYRPQGFVIVGAFPFSLRASLSGVPLPKAEITNYFDVPPITKSESGFVIGNIDFGFLVLRYRRLLVK